MFKRILYRMRNKVRSREYVMTPHARKEMNSDGKTCIYYCLCTLGGSIDMLCDICGQEGARTRRVTETCGKGENLIVIEDIPMVSCSTCGESYFTADTLHEIERIRLHHKNFAVKRPVEVAKFA